MSIQSRPSLPAVLAGALIAVASALAGCGGGGGGGASSAAAAPGTSAPTVTSVSPTTITPPARLSVTGTNLDRVTQARLGSTVLVIASQTPTALGLDVPAGVSTNFLTLVADGASVQAAQQVVVNGSMSVSSLVPASVLTGAALTVNGTGLDRVSSVEFSGGASAAVATRSGTTSLTVTVPAGAVTGPVTLVSATERVPSPSSLTVIPRITVSNPSAVTSAVGATVTLTGSGFGEVSTVIVGGASATITARTNSSISFTVPDVRCGVILLNSTSQPAVAGGSVVTAGGCSLRLESLEFAQVYSQVVGDSYQRLVPGKETLVRAYVFAATPGTGSPTVRLTAFNGTTQLGVIDMAGPPTVPVVALGSAIPDAVRYEEQLTYNASLPATWLTPGLRLQVTVDPEQRFGAPITRSDTPSVGTRTRIELVIVPLVSGTFVPTLSANIVAEAIDELTRRMPVRRENISVTVRAPYTLTRVTDGVDTSAEWSTALQELRDLRAAEGQGRQYYGMVAPVVASGISGIGYVNSQTSTSPLLAALGWDASRASWRRTFIHELGHNYSRGHAPCGSVDSSDQNFPYADGGMGPTPLFDSLADNIVAPTSTPNHRDVMGYCQGSWFSDYNFRQVQTFLERQPQPAGQTLALEAASQGELLIVSGTIGLDGLRLSPAKVTTGEADALPAGDYTLRLQRVDGSVVELPFDAAMVDHAMPPEKHFVLSVPHPGRLASIDVLRGATVLPRADAAQVTAQAAATAARARSSAQPEVMWQEANGMLVLTWDAAAYPALSVGHVDKGRRVLALDLYGGRAELPVADLPSGGSYEFSLSDGMNATRLVARR